MKKNKKFLIFGGVAFFVAILFTILVKFVDVAKAGATLTEVGFSKFNSAIFDFFAPSDIMYKITNYVEYLVLLTAAGYATYGLVQLLKYKKITKIDRGILALGGLFLAVILCYVIFEKLAINYRPVWIDGELEASFPSSHTMITLCICAGIVLLNRTFYAENKKLKSLNYALIFLAAFIVFGRFLSGVHWATDIIGGILWATTLIFFYEHALKLLSQKKAKK